MYTLHDSIWRLNALCSGIRVFTDNLRPGSIIKDTLLCSWSMGLDVNLKIFLPSSI